MNYLRLFLETMGIVFVVIIVIATVAALTTYYVDLRIAHYLATHSHAVCWPSDHQGIDYCKEVKG